MHAQSLKELFDTEDTKEFRNLAEYIKKILTLFRN